MHGKRNRREDRRRQPSSGGSVCTVREVQIQLVPHPNSDRLCYDLKLFAVRGRYDMDDSGTINTHEELYQLSFRCVYHLGLAMPGEEMMAYLRDAPLSEEGMNEQQFIDWFKTNIMVNRNTIKRTSDAVGAKTIQPDHSLQQLKDIAEQMDPASPRHLNQRIATEDYMIGYVSSVMYSVLDLDVSALHCALSPASHSLTHSLIHSFTHSATYCASSWQLEKKYSEVLQTCLVENFSNSLLYGLDEAWINNLDQDERTAASASLLAVFTERIAERNLKVLKIPHTNDVVSAILWCRVW